MTTDRRSLPDISTLAAMGLLVYVVDNLVHEGIGHGGMCLAVGGKPLAISSAWWDGSYEGVSAWGQRAVSAGGTLANLVVGGASVVAFHRRGHQLSAHARYFVWLLGLVNLLGAAGYLMADPVGDFGDWSVFVRGLEHALAWRVGLCATGLLLTRQTLVWGIRTLGTLVGQDPVHPSSRVVLARKLCWCPYLVGGVAFTLAGLVNPKGVVFAFTSALATFGGKTFLAWLPTWVKPGGAAPGPAIVLGRSVGWLLAGGVAAFVLFGLLARSVVLGGAS